MKDRKFYWGYRRRQRFRELQERIKELETWHRIFDEWATHPDYWPLAVEMARQGLTHMDAMLKEYYLPPVTEMLKQRSILLDGIQE